MKLFVIRIDSFRDSNVIGIFDKLELALMRVNKICKVYDIDFVNDLTTESMFGPCPDHYLKYWENGSNSIIILDWELNV